MKYDIETLRKTNNRWTRSDFMFFLGHTDRDAKPTKACLSQWFSCFFEIEGQYYNCAEQFMMAEKARLFGDTEVRDRILSEYNQMTIKKLGRQVRNYDDEKWKSVRYDIVVNGNKAKFSQNLQLKMFLIDTGEKILVEASPKDNVWGIGIDESHVDVANPKKWHGSNLLGFALMEVRDWLIDNKQ